LTTTTYQQQPPYQQHPKIIVDCSDEADDSRQQQLSVMPVRSHVISVAASTAESDDSDCDEYIERRRFTEQRSSAADRSISPSASSRIGGRGVDVRRISSSTSLAEISGGRRQAGSATGARTKCGSSSRPSWSWTLDDLSSAAAVTTATTTVTPYGRRTASPSLRQSNQPLEVRIGEMTKYNTYDILNLIS
jgi:hypothetical protein